MISIFLHFGLIKLINIKSLIHSSILTLITIDESFYSSMFQLGNKEYSLTHLNVKHSIELPSPNKQETTFHTSVIHKNSLYLYAWPDTCSVLKLQNHLEKN